ncbi:MAG TPA: pilus (MSHA type) biogenesis protein MshL [Methylophilaceae bacterium]|nr:pilus (MSHA type) biogenesis protein MshL [Methylophilaceae bacterium]
MKNLWVVSISSILLLSLASCAHQTTVVPSKGHIDGQLNEQEASKPAVVASDIPKPVKNTAYLPPPKAKVKEQTYSVVVNEVPVKEILFALARESKLNVDIHPSIQGRVTLNAVDQTLPAILERLARQVDLTYKIEGNVLYIGPDMPVLRTYKVDYVNMSRDTTGFIGVAAEISGTGRSASTGTSGSTSGNSSGSTGSSSGAASNSSRTQVSSISKHHFWETLIQNIKDILAETDKEVIIGRNGNTAQSENSGGASSAESGDATSPAVPTASAVVSLRTSAQEREEARTEYKTLFAATVIANQEAGIISVRGTNKQHEKVQEFLDKVMSSAKRQVLIEATIVEVRLNDGYQAGINWSRLSELGGTGFIGSGVLGPQIATGLSGASITRGASSPGLVAGYVNGDRGILSSVQLLKQFGDTKVLSSPKLMVLNNQTAVLKVVDNLVYFTVQSQISQATVAGGANLQAITTTANTVPVGVVMSVTPQINDGGAVNINVRPTISSLLRYVADPNPQIPVSNQGIPEIQVREMESMLQINSGNTAVLGGLMQDQIQRNSDKVPGLSEIPGVGRVFTGRNDFSRKTELVIFLRPTVIQNASLESDELQGYKTYLPTPQLEKRLEGNGY